MHEAWLGDKSLSLKWVKEDVRRYSLVAAEDAPETAARWLDRFEASLQTLSTNPERCDLAPEDDWVDQTIRQFFFGKRTGRYRVLLAIENDQVLVLHIRRGTMEKAAEEDLEHYQVWHSCRSLRRS